MGTWSFPNKRILRNNLCLPACKQKNIATKLRDTAQVCWYLFFYAAKQHTISFLLVRYQRLSSQLVKNLLQRNASALFTSCVIRRIFLMAEITKHFTFTVRCFFVYDIYLYPQEGGLIKNGTGLWICTGFQHRPK